MLSIPHMIVVFLVVLVVFGPQKLPELARSFGKLMAEFRKASGDFRNAFEEEMRDLERQAKIAELKKQAAEAVAAAEAITNGTFTPAATLASPAGTTESLPPAQIAEHVTEAPVIVPAPDSIPRLDASAHETALLLSENPAAEVPSAVAQADLHSATNGAHQEVLQFGEKSAEQKSSDPNPSHDQQQPA
jgi:sec-independent protein translocase protein TatB